MKIVQVCPRYFPYIGGVEYVVKSIAERLSKSGHEVLVFTGEPEAKRQKEEIINGVRVIRWPVWAPNDAYYVPRLKDKFEAFFFKEVGEPDVIHFHSVHAIITMYALEVLGPTGVLIVLTPYYHGTGHTFIRRGLWLWWRMLIRKLINKYVDVIHTVSKLEAELIERDFGFKAVPIENGVEEWIPNLTWNPEDYVMYSGRIEKYKNIHLLAKIVKILNSKYLLNFKLKIFGNGPYKKLNELLNNLDIEYELKPPQPFEKYVENLSKARFFGLLSEKESYPQSVNEANAIGVPTLIAMPWGKNFSDRSRTLIVNLNEDLYRVAEEVKELLAQASNVPKSDVPTWKDVVSKYISLLYRKNDE